MPKSTGTQFITKPLNDVARCGLLAMTFCFHTIFINAQGGINGVAVQNTFLPFYSASMLQGGPIFKGNTTTRSSVAVFYGDSSQRNATTIACDCKTTANTSHARLNDKILQEWETIACDGDATTQMCWNPGEQTSV